jgi:hypothetical protein
MWLDSRILFERYQFWSGEFGLCIWNLGKKRILNFMRILDA